MFLFFLYMGTLFLVWVFFSIYCVIDNCYDMDFSLRPLKCVTYIVISNEVSNFHIEVFTAKSRKVLFVLV